MNDERNTPATKGDVLDSAASLREAIDDSKTEILRAIYGYTQTIQAQVKGVQQGEANLKERMAIIEDRMLAVERRLNVPPQ
jgi:hypothetical protein